MISVEESKEFTKKYLDTLVKKRMRNTFRPIREIARIMDEDLNKTTRLVVVAVNNEYMDKDAHYLSNYITFPSLFKVWEDNL